MNSKRLRMVLALVLLVVLSPLVVMAIYVDDWSRDLSQNTAATAPDHEDQRLRPRQATATPQHLNAAVKTFCEKAPAWTLADEKPLPMGSPVATLVDGDSSDTYHLTRRTGLFGFVDDVWLVVEKLDDDRVRLHGDSRSRVGKGDLGQNPRNLRELLSQLEKELRGV